MQQQRGFAVVDLETTGVGKYDRILEIGVVLLSPDLAVEETWETLIQPGRDIPNSFIHKITATDVINAPTFGEVAAHLSYLLNGRTLVAHNAPFERRFLGNEFERAGAENGLADKWLDTMRLAKTHLGVGRLTDAIAAANIQNSFAHSALADAQATAELLRHLRSTYQAEISGYPTALFITAPVAPSANLRQLPRGTENLSWAGQLSKSLPKSGAKDEDRYRAELIHALSDREITRAEAKQLEQTATASGLSVEDVEAINEEFMRQLATEAWADGELTEEELATLRNIADALNVNAAVLHALLDQADNAGVNINLSPGDRVTFTGSLNIPRDEWERRAAAVGLDVGGVTRKSAALIAANPHSMSGKAQKARENGIPIISEAHFAHLIRTMEHVSDPAAVDSSATTQSFPLVAADSSEAASASPAQVASAWIALHPSRPLHEIAENLRPDLAPEATGTSIDRYLAMWSSHYPEMLSATADDLLQLPGVGEKRRAKLVELVFDLADNAMVDAEPSAPLEPPAPEVSTPETSTPSTVERPTHPEPKDSPASAPVQDPVSKERPAANQEPSHAPAPAPMHSSPEDSGSMQVAGKKNGAAKIFKLAASIFVLSFIAFAILINALGLEPETPVSGLLALVILCSGLIALVSGLVALVNHFRK